MGIHIARDAAEEELARAVEWAHSDRPVPSRWAELTEAMDRAPFKTYTPALGTALLAKATDPRVDALAIKENYSARAYSLRGLCHSVLVPAAVRYGFNLRNTGREPLNNQPFFRYDHMTLIDRVGSGALEYLTLLREHLAELNEEGSRRGPAAAGLAAFLRVRFEATARLLKPRLPLVDIPLDSLITIVDQYFRDDVERPRRTQALAAAAFDMIFDDVRTRRLNDPSRDFPGDVQAYDGAAVIMSAEVRAKPVRDTEVVNYVRSLRAAGISRGFVVVDYPRHQQLDREGLVQWAWSTERVVLTLIESAAELMLAISAWSRLPVESLLADFPARAAVRLAEIEVSPLSQARWAELLVSSDTFHSP